ncbi:flagellar hook assembly protein FlgD [Limnohabitans sp. DM1]|uniref:flagellar hook assembly protein FlgD n=1 Tax=Limnohabitans sp. DM1 TaxID=1597955 RepID=UPI000ADCBBC4|nr:flagellar hook capping FlgD N-terminal domain-containing protein [Limnohabitans sp. DM1]
MNASVSSLNSSTPVAKNMATSSAQSGAEMQDRFLKLLVAQLNNQDPMNPMDNAQMTSQMAQINTVTGIQKMQQSIELMTGQMQASQSLHGLQMIGRDVLVNGDRLSAQASGVSRGAFELASSAEQVQLEVFNAVGQKMGSKDLGPLSSGRQDFSINSSDFSQGTHFKIKASQLGQPVQANTMAYDKVVSTANSTPAGLSFKLQNSGEVSYSQIKSVF